MPDGPLIYRQRLLTRITHWVWAISLFFLMLTGLQIFNAFPSLQLGKESGFGYDNAILKIGAVEVGGGLRGVTRIFGVEFDTTGMLGVSGGEARAFPEALTIPSKTSLATGRVIHFFFAWVLVLALGLWLVASAVNGHLGQLIPTVADLRALPRDIADHARLRLHRSGEYSVLQKLAYASVLFVALPLMILTGLSMSPGVNAAAPWLLDLFQGRQTARTIHFLTMLALLGFFAVHMAMILLAGPVNEMRSILTGWYRTGGDDHA
ncbi:cytochrome b/b6 domain-containing protein [Tabrizicola sp.]|uniref:cytochrome b/b6 domain-containing protein n=1 Tax=Tabrizicola sp. TaxID=2005166 RepID=UPI0025ECE004|nr:cytochrome b/b6 domain-containing protein [Tabrizicola sp.]MBY0349714.1 cytochrome b/b6 domain-containing protein [Tabrizicola sp.]MDK2773977.1 cytochrome b/b6 domain-containing protein [Tabrizicola sp.]